MTDGEAPVRTLLIDNYDSYTYNLFHQLAGVNGGEPTVVRNDECDWDVLAALRPDNIVISPGPGRPEVPSDFGLCRDAIATARVPILGVCLGHQGIAVGWGAHTTPAPEVMHGRISTVRHRGHPLFAGVPQDFEVVRYHSLVIAEPLPPGLVPIAWADDGVLMGLAREDRAQYGVQFHPESILTRHGDRIIENFRDLTLARAGRRGRGRRVARRSPAAHPEAPRPGTPDRARRRPYVEHRRIPGPFDPESVFLRLRAGAEAVWLDSARTGVQTGRFSYLAFVPGGPLHEVVRFDAASRRVRIDGPEGRRVLPDTDIYQHLAERLDELRVDPQDAPELPFDFVGGYVGWLGYECTPEPVSSALHRAPTDDAALLLADRLVVLDHAGGDAYLVALVAPGGASCAQRWLAATAARLEQCRAEEPGPLPPVPGRAVAHPTRGRRQYLKDVEVCQDLLRAGETYEVCLTTRFEASLPMPPVDVYRRLRRLNPAPYAAFLDFGDTQVSCSSPERFLRVDAAGRVSARPIKGTRRRGGDAAEDRRLAADLAVDLKERAENLMIVDLLRNDLGRVCQPGSIEVSRLMEVESFETVHQLVSTVEGQLPPDRSAVDCVRAAFPGGSMTGAPKVRTMQILRQLEGHARGVYSGTIGFLSVNGAADLNIVIRTLVQQGDRIHVGAGGALTVLSQAEQEWAEIRLKAEAVLATVDVSVADEGPPA
ncbi:aminodeoxychorismate synthase component I [Micromonospora sp. DT233]|uniref:aminodeoxychorismate synthase component I n=1 Tax=Micromonospora sp. DT233 TaxID=3393432 RepID=UPI003CE7A284